MSGKYFSPFSLRISDELMKKLKIIASLNSRSTNKEIEYILKQFVSQYESQHGVLDTFMQDESL